jgi:phytoene synthase
MTGHLNLASPSTSRRREPEAATAFAAARNICRRHGGDLFFASAFLPVEKRDALLAVQAFCRLMKDAIGATKSSEAPISAPSTAAASCCSTLSVDQTLALFRDRLDQIYDHRLELPLPRFRDESQHALAALERTVHRYQIPRQSFLELADGYRMDQTVRRYATWRALEKHCSQVGGVVARMMCCILGVGHSDAGQQAMLLGNTMRLTNILRDLKEDWLRGTLYLPLEDLARFKVSQREIADGGTVTDNFQRLMQFQIARARDLYRAGAAGICWLEADGSRLAASAMAVIHAGILTAIERLGYDVFHHRAHLTSSQKLRRLAPAWRLARRKADQRMPNVFA